MSNPVLSIITVSYNSESTIQRTLDSVKDVDRDDVEHIIVDGGSSDNTLKIAARYEYLQVYSG
ncbi:MAG: glycosyltransferase, partial [Proteobacteria bacterium]|nr:glycosyltransferase [Pseudomonadota bacterium]